MAEVGSANVGEPSNSAGEPVLNNHSNQNGKGPATGTSDGKAVPKNNKKINKNNRRQKMYNNVQSLFSTGFQNYDLRNMLGHHGGSFYHQPQRLYYKKQPRTNNNKNQNADKKKNDKTDGPIDDITNQHKYAIVHEDYPQTLFTEDEFNQIQMKLTNAMLGTQEFLRFHSCLLRHGAVVIYCYDDNSQNWLVNLINNTDFEMKLKIGLAKDIILSANVTFTVSKLLNLENDQIMELLKSQNKGLRTELWQILETKSTETDNQISVAIDEDSFKVIKADSYQAYLGLGMIRFSNSQYYNVVTYTPPE